MQRDLLLGTGAIVHFHLLAHVRHSVGHIHLEHIDASCGVRFFVFACDGVILR